MSGKTMETTVKINGEVDASTKKAIDAVADSMDAIQEAAEKAAGPAGELIATINKQSKTLKKAQLAYASYVLKGEESSKAAQDLADEIQKLSSDLERNRSALNDAEQAAKKLSDGFNDAGDSAGNLDDAASGSSGGFTIMKGAIANLVSSGIQFLISKAGEAVTALFDLSEQTQEYREDMGKLETAWESAGLSTDLATKTYKDFYSVLGEEDRSVEAVNHLAKFVDTEKDMSKWTDIATGVWGTFGDSLPIEGLTEAANETAKVGQVTGPLADALNWAGVSEDQFNQKLASCGDEQERAALITQTLSGLYGDAAENYRENNSSIIEARKATSDFADAQANLGEQMEPLNTALTVLKTQALQAFTPILVSIISKVVQLAQTVLPPLISFIQTYVVPVIKVLAGAISGTLGFAIDTVKQLLGSLKQIFGGLINFLTGVFTGNWSQAWQGVVSIFKGIVSGLVGIIKAPINGVISIINGAINAINGIGFTIPDWVPVIGGKSFSVDIPNIPMLASGGFTEGVSIAGEEGTEAVISFNPAYRDENLSYWAKAGRMLGATTEDFSLDGNGSYTSVDLGGVSFSPNITIAGNADKGDIIKAIRAEYPEFLDLLKKALTESEELQYA